MFFWIMENNEGYQTPKKKLIILFIFSQKIMIRNASGLSATISKMTFGIEN